MTIVVATADARPDVEASCAAPSGLRGLWLQYHLYPEGRGQSNPALCVRIDGPFDVERFEWALNTLVARHAMLRARFEEADGELLQIIAPFAAARVEIFDAAGDDDATLRRRLADDYARAFDFSCAPLLRASVYKLGDRQSALLLVFEHLICDAWSFWRLLEDLDALLCGAEPAATTSAEDEGASYFAYTQQQREWLAGAKGQKQLAYWRDALRDECPALHLPEARPDARAHATGRGSIAFALGRELTESVKQLAAANQTTLYVTLFSAYFILLRRLTGEERISVGSAMPGRTDRKFRSVVGNFINLVCLRTDFRSDMTVRDLLRDVRGLARRAMVNQEYPFFDLVEQLNPRRDRGRHPFFETLFGLQNARGASKAVDLVADDTEGRKVSWGGYEVSLFFRPSNNGADAFDLALDMIEREEWVAGAFNFSTAVFDPATIERYVGYFRTIVEAMTKDDSTLVDDLSLLDRPAQLRAVEDAAAPESAPPENRLAHELIEAQAARTPHAVAVSHGDAKLTYGELNAQANRLARHLRDSGVKENTIVAICADRGVDMVAALLAIWKAGAAYLPLDPSYPAERLRMMLEDSVPAAIVTTKGAASEALATALIGRNTVPPIIDLASNKWADLPADNLDELTGDASSRLAYVLYTSGSTGRPKGVMVEHPSVLNLLRSMLALTGAGPGDKALALTSLAFDIAALELWLPLMCGGETSFAPATANFDPEVLGRTLADRGITLMQATPATWRMLVDSGWSGAPALKALCGGEALTLELAGKIRERVGSLWNMYGPTETTIWSSAYMVEPHHHGGGFASIGRPLANTSIYLLDERGALAPIGVKAEICIGGAGVARGYLNRPELTAEKFVPDPFADVALTPAAGPVPAPRMYRTGDLGRRLADGAIEFLGRGDSQIKLRGFRIELGEIEARLAAHPSVSQAAVVARENDGGDLSLIAYYTTVDASHPPVSEQLAAFVRAALPAYMIPAWFVELQTMPLTPNGKLDRKALPAPDLAIRDGGAPHRREPISSTEQAIAQIWSEILKLPKIARDDDFFDLGGHSLLAAKMVVKVNEALNVNVPVAAVFARPTLAEFAAAISTNAQSSEQADETGAASSVDETGVDPRIISYGRPLSGGPEFPSPIFAIGNVTISRPLAIRLAEKGQPFFTVQALEAEWPELATRPTIEKIAEFYVDLLRRFQPQGPYILLGFCGTAPLAFEIARQLGESTALLIVIDAWAPDQLRRRGRLKILALLMSYWIRRRSWLLKSLGSIWSAEGLRAALQLLPLYGRIKGFRQRRQIERVNRHDSHVLDTATRYVPDPINRPVLVICGETQPRGRGVCATLGWSDFTTGPIESVIVPGDHERMFDPTNVETLAQAIIKRAKASVA